MMRVFQLGTLLGLCLGIFAIAVPRPVAAADLYTVKGVHVDVTAASASEARSIAQANAQSDGLDQLMRRLTSSSDWSRLPKVNNITVQNAVRGFQVASEKSSSTRYIADLNVSFNPSAVRSILRGAGILYSETQAKQALLVPVYVKGGKPDLWDANPWQDALAHNDLENALTPLLLPVGDIEEFTILTANQAIVGDQSAITTLAQRYGTDDVVVAVATSNADGTSISVKATRYAPAASTPINRTYQNIDDAAAGLIAALSEQWKSETIIAPGSQARLTASVSFLGLDQWQAIRQGLSSTPLVNGLQVDGITSTSAEVQISYRGTSDKLALALAQANIELTQAATGDWLLQSR